MSSTLQDSRHTDDTSPITGYGPRRVVPIRVASVDGGVQVSLGEHDLHLDGAGARDLLNAVATALALPRDDGVQVSFGEQEFYLEHGDACSVIQAAAEALLATL